MIHERIGFSPEANQFVPSTFKSIFFGDILQTDGYETHNLLGGDNYYYYNY